MAKSNSIDLGDYIVLTEDDINRLRAGQDIVVTEDGVYVIVITPESKENSKPLS